MKRVLEAALHKTIVCVIFCRIFCFSSSTSPPQSLICFLCHYKTALLTVGMKHGTKECFDNDLIFSAHNYLQSSSQKLLSIHNITTYCFMWSKPRKETILIVLVGICFVFFIRFQLLFLEFASRSSDDKSDNIILFVRNLFIGKII